MQKRLIQGDGIGPLETVLSTVRVPESGLECAFWVWKGVAEIMNTIMYVLVLFLFQALGCTNGIVEP